MQKYVLDFQEVKKNDLLQVGGKGLNLAELARVPGIQVPAGFCITTNVFKRIVEDNQVFTELMEELAILESSDLDRIRLISEKLRNAIETTKIPEEIKLEIVDSFEKLGSELTYAVRSSATAEDLPTASFAGQQDSFLNIQGKEQLLKHISKCWASLFTERAVVYRIQNGFDHRKVLLSVIIQQMVFPIASGILFTADPVTSNRKMVSIDASFGLGEALVSGIVSADNYKVKEGQIIQKTVSLKKIAVYPLSRGGTEQREIPFELQEQQVLSDEQVLALEGLGRQIEKHFGTPQDIEWCLVDESIYIVQSRPITTLFPLPEKSDGEYRIYLSIGHQQMMTDPINPLGMSFFEFLADYNIERAGGRLFMDLSPELASVTGRIFMLASLGSNDPLMKDALINFMKRKPPLPKGKRIYKFGSEPFTWGFPVELLKLYRKNDPRLTSQLINMSEASIRSLEWRIQTFSRDELFEFIKEDQKQLKKEIYNQESFGVIVVGIFAVYWLNNYMEKWLGEKKAADILSQSVAHNVTSEMGLELLDVTDVVRNYPKVQAYFENPRKATFFEDLEKMQGGKAVSTALREYLEKYGMRCAGEIDITKTRWSEDPTILAPVILGNNKNFEPHARAAKVAEGKRKAKQKEQELLERLAKLPGGKRKVKKTKQMISMLQNFLGYREYPKFAFIKRYFLYKQAMMKEAVFLHEKGEIQAPEDVYYLSFDEFRDAVNGKSVDRQMIEERKAAYRYYEKLKVPRLMTSEGEEIFGNYQNDKLPIGAFPGIAVSAGVIEGRARVILKMEDAQIEPGDILITAFTDPSWTPLFVSLSGLVTEVGGLMTHGAVIAREYGLPAVVGVVNATTVIKDGQKIRINGAEGYVEVLE
ncbi:pyruvate,water dikinase [Planomicrobium stackebrandtii]|uniref:Pyruvate,water dikinase n=1 Tax=Planomicrobium stackebrandtii TaxID=253160 RepID=A0ABU0GPB4_9BACL|nr:phosphoenolpyruvate synthase [Planomicrobium stackebrandtii]MDQ0427205.1 pyruvate,water dikinase [Planomicrobium stackebrandtii]